MFDAIKLLQHTTLVSVAWLIHSAWMREAKSDIRGNAERVAKRNQAYYRVYPIESFDGFFGVQL